MPKLRAETLKQFTQQVFEAGGAPTGEAAIVADHLVTANLMGVDSHGVIRISQYVQGIREGSIIPGAPIMVKEETLTTAIVDGGWNFGLVAARRAMEIAVSKAQDSHTACVVTQRCGHAGRIGTFTQYAAERGFIAIAVCNSARHGHFVLPWGGKEGRLATNPISYAVPTGFGDPIVSDFSTSAAPEGKIRLHLDAKKALPEGWIMDANGNPSVNPADFYGPPQGAILPFGGQSGFRGYALGLFVEIMGATLSGMDMTIDRPGNDLAFIVIDVSAFLPREHFYQLMTNLKTYVKSSPPAAGFDEVLLPGEPEFRTAEQRRREGIEVNDATWAEVLRSASSLGVEWPPRVPPRTGAS